MSNPRLVTDLTGLVRQFIRDLREHLLVLATQGDDTEVVERAFATISALIAAVLMAHPKTRGKVTLIGALLGIAVRFFTKKGIAHAVIIETDQDHSHV